MRKGDFRPRPAAMFALGLVLLAWGVCPVPAGAQAVRTQYTVAELVPEQVSVAPGDSFRVALRLQPDPGWYVYWHNPGDAGLAPTLNWILPQGFTAGEMQFPYPQRMRNPPFASYGYPAEVWYPTWLRVSPDARPGRQVLQAEAVWLICKEECLPDDAALSVPIEVGAARANQARAGQWRAALENLPVKAPDWEWRIRYLPATLEISWRKSGDDPGEILFFPLETGVIEHNAEQAVREEGDRRVLVLRRDSTVRAKPAVLQGVLVSEAGWTLREGENSRTARALELEIRNDTKPPTTWFSIVAVLLAGAALAGTVVLLRRGRRYRKNYA